MVAELHFELVEKVVNLPDNKQMHFVMIKVFEGDEVYYVADKEGYPVDFGSKEAAEKFLETEYKLAKDEFYDGE